MLKLLANRASLLFLLSMTAGAVDTIGFLGLGGLFAAHITGNIVIIAAHFVTGKFSQVGPLLAVPVFMIVLWMVVLMAGKMERARVSLLKPLVLLQLLLLVCSFIVVLIGGPLTNMDGLGIVSIGMLAVSAMAVQSATVKLALKKAPSTVAMTNNITQLSLDLAMLEHQRKGSKEEYTAAKEQATVTFSSVIGFIFGCGIGAVLQVQYDLMALLFPIMLTVLTLIFSLICWA